MSQTNDIHKAAGIIIKNRKLLVEHSVGKEFFIAPGGTIEPGESATQALVRELREEFAIETREEDFVPFGTFSAPAANHPGRQVHSQVFTVRAWQGEPRASSEVEEIFWLTSQIPEGMKVGSIVAHEIIPRLKAQGLID